MADVWETLKYLPQGLHETANEFLMDPTSQNPLGGQQNAHDYLMQLLKNQGGEGLLEGALKGAGEGLVDTFVPRTSLDVAQAGATAAAGGALKGAQGLQAAGKSAEAAKGARGVAKIKDLNQRIRGPKNTEVTPGGKVAQKGYFSGAKAKAARADKTWQEAAGGRPSPGQVKSFDQRQAAMPKQTGPAGPSSFLEEQSRMPPAPSTGTGGAEIQALMERLQSAGLTPEQISLVLRSRLMP